MKDDQFSKVIFSAQGKLQEMSVAFIEINNDLLLYTFEFYASMKFDTAKWNTLRTH